MSYPKHAYPSARAFKAKKRKDMRVVMAALAELRAGVAYVPMQDKFDDAVTLLTDMQRAMRVIEWGR